MANKPSTSHNLVFDLDDNVIQYDVEAFDTLIRSQGPTLIHKRVYPCVVGKVSTDDQRRPGCDKPGHCQNGMVNVLAGEVTLAMTHNSNKLKQLEYRLDGSSAHCTFPRFYDNTKTPVNLMIGDRFELKETDIPVPDFDQFECHISGVDRLKFPATVVTDLEDSRGRRYTQGIDFTVSKGAIHWLPGKSPGQDPDTGSGIVCAARYLYIPFWILNDFVNQIRMCQVQVAEGLRKIERMPQGAILVRETYHQNVNQSVGYAERKVIAAPRGSFGPR